MKETLNFSQSFDDIAVPEILSCVLRTYTGINNLRDMRRLKTILICQDNGFESKIAIRTGESLLVCQPIFTL